MQLYGTEGLTLEGTLVVNILATLAAALLYLYVGLTISQRDVSEAARTPTRLFATWWYALGTTSILGVLPQIGALAGFTDLGLHLVLTYANLAVLCLALWALLCYLLYIFVGMREALAPIGVLYAAYFGLLVYYVTRLEPQGVLIERWSVTIDYAFEASGGFTLIVLLLLVLPQILGSLAYFSLFFRLRDRSLRYRVAVVSWSIIIWFGSALVASIFDLGEADWWQVVSRLIGLTAALAILMAYRPPAFVQRWLGVRSVVGDVEVGHGMATTGGEAGAPGGPLGEASEGEGEVEEA